MNKSIRLVSTFSLLLILVLLINITIIQAFKQDEYAHNALNKRGFIELKEQPRGQISAHGEVLAASKQDANGFYQRSYPADDPATFSPLTGYLSDRYGASNLEATYNDVLSGKDPSLGARRLWDTILGREDKSANVELTLNPEVQRVAQEQLNNNGYDGAVVALKPSTGEVLALASTPSYDPNQIEESWDAITADPAQPLINHATQETLPPGSIFKIITTAAGLKKGYTANSQLTGDASITLPGTETTLTNYNNQQCAGGGQVTLTTAFSLSCNTAFVQMGIDVGRKGLEEAAHGFGIGETYDLGLEMAPGSLGDIPDDAALGQTSIGQRDVTMSALQAAVMAGTVANEGRRMAPHVVDRITSPDLRELRTIEPHEVTQATTPEVAGQLEKLMLASEQASYQGAGTGLASKTGTAEHGEGLNPHTWYVAYDPADGADIAVAVVVKDGGNQGMSATGGKVSSPIGRAVLAAARKEAGND